VTSNDVIMARNLEAELTAVGERQPHLAGPAANAANTLKGWFREHERSFSGRIGFRIAQGIAKARQDISTYMEALRAVEAASDIPAQIEEQQQRLGRKLKLMSAVALLSIVAVVVLTLLGPPGWLFLAAAIAVILTLWLMSSALTFTRAQRDLFALLHRRRELAGQMEVLLQHLMDAVEDLRRVTRAYRQYLDWSKAFGRFVAAPLGRPPTLVDDEVVLGNGLPRNHRFGAANPDPSVLDEVATRLKRDLFGVGWASQAWEAYLADVPAEAGAQAFRIREDVDVLFADPGVTSESLLTSWADAVAVRGDWAGATDNLRAKVSDVMIAAGADLGPRLLAQVETRDSQGTLATVDYDAFVNQLDQQATGAVDHQSFAKDLFGPQATSEPWRVESTVARQTSADFGRTIVVTQFSHGFQGYELNLDLPGVDPMDLGQGRPPSEPPSSAGPFI
jgi:hypothetical protein